jgi:hypothetical protein
VDEHVTIALDPDLEKEVAKLIAKGDDALKVAKAIAEVARSNAPHESGDYAAGIRAEKTKGGARVIAADYKSAWIEFGVPSRGIPAQFNLRRAVDAVGLKFRKRKG